MLRRQEFDLGSLKTERSDAERQRLTVFGESQVQTNKLTKSLTFFSNNPVFWLCGGIQLSIYAGESGAVTWKPS